MSYFFFTFLLPSHTGCVSVVGYLLIVIVFNFLFIYLSMCLNYDLGPILFHRIIGSLIFKITLLPVCHVLLFPFLMCIFILFLFVLNMLISYLLASTVLLDICMLYFLICMIYYLKILCFTHEVKD